MPRPPDDTLRSPVQPIRVGPFKGLNNRLDPTALGLEWQLRAENALCDDAGYLTRAPSPRAHESGYKDLFATRAGRLLFITDDDALVERSDAGVTTVLAEGVTGAPFCWAELGPVLFLMSRRGQWAVYPDRVLPWGVTVADADDPACSPPPVGEVIAAQRSRIAVAVWEPEHDRSVVYFSRADYPHEFRLDRDFQLFAGRITLLATVSQGAIIATDRAVFVDPFEAPLMRVADYGAPPGALIADDQDTVFFWTHRGLCKALPFASLTDAQFVPPPLRAQATGGILPWQGSTYAAVSLQGRSDAATRSVPFTPLPLTS